MENETKTRPKIDQKEELFEVAEEPGPSEPAPLDERDVERLVPDYPFTPHFLASVPDDHYHADRSAISSSQLRKMLKSPATFKAAFDGKIKHAETDAMTFGRLLHFVVLEDPDLKAGYVVIPKGTYNLRRPADRFAKAAWEKEQQAAGRIVVTQKEFDDLRYMLDSLRGHPGAALLLTNGTPEQSGYYVDPQSGVRCRIRPDFINTHVDAIIDLKSVLDCSPRAFIKSVTNYRYDFQLAMYGAGYEQIIGKPVEYFAFIAIEKTPPYECAVYTCDQQMIAKGHSDYLKCLSKLRECIDTGAWPQAHPNIHEISLPDWMLKQD